MRIKTITNLIIIFLSLGLVLPRLTSADWWERPTDRPDQPSYDRDIPTTAPTNPPEEEVEPTNPPAGEPTATPLPQGGPTEEPTDEDNEEPTDENGDPCDPGKSYTGDYCGWSPGIDEGNGGGIGGTDYYDPGVLGLSYTSGEEIGISDIMLLIGALCLLMYAKSKFLPNVDLKIKTNRRRH